MVPVSDNNATEASVRGLEETVDLLRDSIGWSEEQQAIRRELRVQPSSGILLQGPPGCGKTLLVRALAKEFGASLHLVLASAIFDAHTGSSENRLRDAFKAAQQEAEQGKRTILFFDEVDALCPRRVSGQDHEVRVVAQMLTLMDGALRHADLMGRLAIIAATNRPGALDPALRRAGRLDREIHIPLPKQQARQAILSLQTANMPLGSDFDVSAIAAQTNGFSGSDLAGLCREAGVTAMSRNLDHPSSSNRDQVEGQGSSSEVLQEDFLQALKSVQSSINRSHITEFPPVSWDVVGGLGEVKRRLCQAVVWPLTHREAFQRLGLKAPQGVLIHGPPGCCKTTLVKAAVTASGASVQVLTAANLYSSLVGEGEALLRGVFSRAKAASPAIIFLDEIDAIAGSRETQSEEDHSSRQILSSLLTEMDGIEMAEGVLVLAATNRRQAVDPALLRPGRFDVHIEVPLPSEEEREEILKIHSRHLSLGDDCDFREVAGQTKGSSGADLEALCREAALAALHESFQRKTPGAERRVYMRHFQAALLAA